MSPPTSLRLPHLTITTTTTTTILLLSLLIPFLSLTVHATPNCLASNATIYLDLANNNVNGNSRLQQYGIAVGVGTPLQNNSLWPSITHNETALVQPDYCGAFSPKSCGENYHGFLVIQDSSTWTNQSTFYGSTDNLTAYNNVSGVFGKDVFELYNTRPAASHRGNSTNLYGYPMAALQNYSSTLNPFFGPGGTIGLGPASTLLDRLYSDQLIVGYSYALYTGSLYARQAGTQTGSLVLGGYDAQRFSGSVLTYPLTAATGGLQATSWSPFKISVTGMSLNPKGGKSTDLLSGNGGGGFDAVLTTSQYPMQFPAGVTRQLSSALNLSPADNDESTFKAATAFQGTLTVTLSNNLTFTFDASWLTNTTENTTPISTAASSSLAMPAVFGAAFLSQAYLFVQYDATPPTFSLAQVRPYNSKTVDLQPLCSGLVPVSAVSSSTNNGNNSGDGGGGNHSSPSKSTSHVGAIAGSVVAVVLVLFAILLLYFCCFRGLASRVFGRPNPTRESVANQPMSPGGVGVGGRRRTMSGAGAGGRGRFGFGDGKDVLEEHMYSRSGWERTTSKEDVSRVLTKEVGGAGGGRGYGGGGDIEMSPLSDRGRF